MIKYQTNSLFKNQNDKQKTNKQLNPWSRKTKYQMYLLLKILIINNNKNLSKNKVYKIMNCKWLISKMKECIQVKILLDQTKQQEIKINKNVIT